ncbi:CaiB/BaiF CoA-transferase family protein [Phenylobacterium sp.]|uniref:CaiB/BaiF CoA transferase family protein n=1 Tax=Phenylobacterium sp. TaxID=1871053 RepID=UPI00272FD957|nr:CaiB/BaiF CoA-transferase family protein [Phenylobacterium sp.]MDP1598956.1 CaiB/BaiF CoA-transferase family protein [Phenylobacterium sp.]MDP3594284.1 CaiB/BaiF CoA-transferase family protein [Phenylobacterium sp.]
MLLQGLKVIEFASYIAAPGAAGILADWGAEVIKVERPEGDPMRNVFGDAKSALSGNPTFGLDNRGKRAVVLDTSKPEGREALTRLAAEADIFLTNVRPASLKRAGLDDETLRAANPRLIYAVVTGYGLDGPDAAKPGFDVTAFWSRAGVAHMHAPKGTDPFILRTGVGDHTTSLATVSAILAAVYEREKTGVGRLVQTSLLATGVYTVGSDMAVQLAFGKLASNRPRSAPFDPTANFYKSRDGHWFVLNPRGGGKDWQLLATACGRPDLLEDERFPTGRLRKDNSVALVAELDDAFGGLDFEDIARRLDEVDLVWAPVQTPAQVAADPQVAAAGALIDVEDGQGGTYRSPAAPARFPGADATVRPAAPGLGQHTREVLAEIGYAPAEIEAMLASGSAA